RRLPDRHRGGSDHRPRRDRDLRAADLAVTLALAQLQPPVLGHLRLVLLAAVVAQDLVAVAERLVVGIAGVAGGAFELVEPPPLALRAGPVVLLLVERVRVVRHGGTSGIPPRSRSLRQGPGPGQRPPAGARWRGRGAAATAL